MEDVVNSPGTCTKLLTSLLKKVNLDDPSGAPNSPCSRNEVVHAQYHAFGNESVTGCDPKNPAS